MRSTTLLLLICKQWNLVLSPRMLLIFVLAKSLLHEVRPPLDHNHSFVFWLKIMQPTAIYTGTMWKKVCEYTTDRANVEHSVKATKLSIRQLRQRKSIEWSMIRGKSAVPHF